MRKIIFTLLLSFFIFICAESQIQYDPIKWFVRPSFGSSFALNPKDFGFITDNLTSYSNQNFYWQVISTGHFFNDWGIEFYYLRNYNNQSKDRFNRFSTEVSNKYGNGYFIDINTGFYYDKSTSQGNLLERGSIGPIYKIENNKTIFIFRGMIGVISFSSDWGSAYLKEKGTNSIVDVNWSSDKTVKDFFTFNPSFTFGYRITKRIVLDFDINYWFYNLDFKYNETRTDFITTETVNTGYHYKRLSNDLSIGAGFMIILK